MRYVLWCLVAIALTFGVSGCSSNKENKVSDTNSGSLVATIKTDKGDFSFTLDQKNSPNSVKTFENMAPKYAGRIFHRVEDWVVQGGDPTGNGTGGGDQATELSSQPFTIGSVGIARAGDIKVSNDAQFFICKTDCSFLTGQYTYLGQVNSGMDVVNKIQIGDKINSVNISQ